MARSEETLKIVGAEKIEVYQVAFKDFLLTSGVVACGVPESWKILAWWPAADAAVRPRGNRSFVHNAVSMRRGDRP